MTAGAAPRHQSFASLRHSGYRAFFVGSATAMLADSIEHVISYWVVFQKFHVRVSRRPRTVRLMAVVP